MRELQAELARCRVRQAIVAYFNRLIESVTKSAENAESEKVKDLSFTLVARYEKKKGDALDTHLMECRFCGAVDEREGEHSGA